METRRRNLQPPSLPKDAGMVKGYSSNSMNSRSDGSVEMIRAKTTCRNIVFFGPPGVGKGVQARIVSERDHLAYLSTGDAIRDHVRRNTDLGRRVKDAIARGLFADDETVVSIVAENLDREAFQGGFILDGFPRNVRQAKQLDQLLAKRGRRIDCVVFLRAPEQTILERVSGRLVCQECGCSYHAAFRRPRVDGECDACGGGICRRPDDEPQACRQRLRIYTEQTAPLEQYYAQHNLLAYVDSARAPEEVALSIAHALGHGASST